VRNDEHAVSQSATETARCNRQWCVVVVRNDASDACIVVIIINIVYVDKTSAQ
jgi:hypothetical protein